MDLLPSPEQSEIVASAASLLAGRLPMARVRELHGAPSSIDPSLWSECASLGWFGLGLPELDGGVGYGLAEEALLFREIGRALAPGPFLGTVLGARVAPADVRASILAGTAVVALAERRPGDGDRVDVLDGVGADLVVVVDPDAAALFEVSAFGAVEPVACLDPGTRLATATMPAGDGLARVVGGGPWLRGAVLVAAMASGVAEAARDLAATHARDRVQFGKPIGVNQAIKHACTDMAVRAEAAACQTFLAAMTVEVGLPDAPFQAAAAKVVATDAALANARANVQVHGGMGFTWEHDAHLLVKRAHVLSRVLGDRTRHLADLLALPAAQ